jgi:hypothetical protein
MTRSFAASVLFLVAALVAYGQGLGAVGAALETAPTTAADCGCHDAEGDCGPATKEPCDWGAGCALRCGPSAGFVASGPRLPVVLSPARAAARSPAERPDSLSGSPPFRPPRFAILA